MIKLFNTFSQKLEVFQPHTKAVTLYVCGITPYDTTHLGHAFTYVSFDILVRFLKWQEYPVIYTQNVTDIDDPLFERARKLRVDWKDLGNQWTTRFLEDMKILNVNPPDHYTRVTGEIPMIKKIIRKLFDHGLAYQSGGNVYFDVKKDKEYGKLSKLSVDRMIAISKERGNDPKDPRKRNPLDFVLWQMSKEDEPSWDSPWGKGRPGWHIECSAMATKYLGEQITIHGGGTDLIFPHHESEIAQSENASGKILFVQYWMHVGMVSYQGKKMSKSLGNLILVKDLLKRYTPFTIRWYLLSHHYRKEWEFFEKDIKKIEQKAREVKQKIIVDDTPVTSYQKDFQEALSNDLNTSQALEIIENYPHKRFMDILGLPT